MQFNSSVITRTIFKVRPISILKITGNYFPLLFIRACPDVSFVFFYHQMQVQIICLPTCTDQFWIVSRLKLPVNTFQPDAYLFQPTHHVGCPGVVTSP